ncbi:COG1272: Predicted membrane protein hemolysin III homolog [Klebsiella pneumoniae IS43]|uniref:COG1272: Predicted membrane protein hemolysin III homolog n=1 Tax=Klebsiella pneumoniae IS43 TaxID=1432552 RepID=W1DU02_KLEPN|nr:COG1272: Predicted membrane protein hemolysin III homolog [Klebsiella pneumoniae IS43]
MVRKPLITQGYSLAEEVANSISHGIGLVFGIVGLVLLLVQAADTNASATAIASYSLYGGSMIMLFLASTLYHAIPHQRAKQWLKKFDHCAIYLLIAGTYTPFLLVGLNSPLAKGLMIVIWSLALLGILFKLTIAHRFKIFVAGDLSDHGVAVAYRGLSAGGEAGGGRGNAAGGWRGGVLAGGHLLRLQTYSL